MIKDQTETNPEFELPLESSSRPIDILALGSLVLEQIITVNEWPAQGGQDVIPVESMSYVSGGCAMNVASFAGRAGGNAAVISTIGDGRYSKEVWDELARSNVNTDYLRCHKGKDGSLIVILSIPTGDWVVLDHLDLELKLEVEDLPSEAEFKKAKILHVDGFSFLNAGKKAAVREGLRCARKAGCIISSDSSVPAVKNEPDFMKEIFQQSDIIFANEFEALTITQTKTVEDAITAIRRMGPQVGVIKLGKKGSYIVTSTAIGFVPAYEVIVKDTVAAGDSYIAYTLLSLCKKAPLMTAANRGSAAGALACLGRGSLGSFFKMEDVEKLIERGPKL